MPAYNDHLCKKPSKVAGVGPLKYLQHRALDHGELCTMKYNLLDIIQISISYISTIWKELIFIKSTCMSHISDSNLIHAWCTNYICMSLVSILFCVCHVVANYVATMLAIFMYRCDMGGYKEPWCTMRDLIGAVMSHDHALHVTTQELKLCSYELHTYVGR